MIRTLILQGISNGIITCTIQKINASKGGYQALLYIWGSRDRLFHVVVVDEKGELVGRIPLIKNLNYALYDL